MSSENPVARPDTQLQAVTKRFAGMVAVDALDLTVPRGQFLTILGPSGCGKTTTLRMIAGLERPDEGVITQGSTVVYSAKSKAFLPPNKRDISMVFQSYALWPHMTVSQNISYPLRSRGVDKSAVAGAVRDALLLVGLEGFGDRSINALSGGQQQRVALARAIVGRPRLLLFDEPLSNLDAKLRAEMRRELRRVHAHLQGTSIYVTHDQLEALTLSDRIIVMDAGRIQQDGTPHEIFDRPRNRFVADFVGYENVFDAVIERTSGHTRAAVEGWRVPIIVDRSTDGAAAPDAVAMRASALAFTDDVGDVNVVAGVVRDIEYLGEVTRYVVHVAPHDVTVVMGSESTTMMPKGGLSQGSEVLVKIDPEKVRVIA